MPADIVHEDNPALVRIARKTKRKHAAEMAAYEARIGASSSSYIQAATNQKENENNQ